MKLINNNCPSNHEFEKYLNGDSSEEQIIRFDSHLSECSLCQEAVEGYKQAFVMGQLNKPRKQKLEKPVLFSVFVKRFIPYAAAIVVLFAIVFSNSFELFDKSNSIVESDFENLLNTNKTLLHKTDASYWCIQSDNQLAINDQFVSSRQLKSATIQDQTVSQIYIQVDVENSELVEGLVSDIKAIKQVPVFIYSKHKGLKKN